MNLEPENPFTPTFGEVPAYMAGRGELINNLRKAFSQTTRSPYLATLITGARGTGKTAILSLACQEAEGRGWVSVRTVARPGLLDDVLITARRASRHLVGERDGRHLTGFGIGQLVSVEWEREDAEPNNWRGRMTDLLEELEESGTGLLIAVDEVRPDLEELVHLVAVYQLFVQERRKVALLMAGLPHNVMQIMQDKSVSFARRAQTVHLGRLDDSEVELALKRTVESSGRTIGQEALALLTKASAGFPFMVQLVGFRAWDMDASCQEITPEAARQGIELARKEFESRIIVSTYLSLSNGDRCFLKALAACGRESCRTADIARAWDKSTAYAAQYKRRLLDQGVIEEKIDGSLAFAVPFMDEFMLAAV